MKRFWIVLLVLLLIMPFAFAKGEKEVSEDDADAEKPVLHILNSNVSTNLASTVEYQVITEVSGYSVNFTSGNVLELARNKRTFVLAVRRF